VLWLGLRVKLGSEIGSYIREVNFLCGGEMLGYVQFAATRRIAQAEINTDSAKQCERVSVSGPG